MRAKKASLSKKRLICLFAFGSDGNGVWSQSTREGSSKTWLFDRKYRLVQFRNAVWVKNSRVSVSFRCQKVICTQLSKTSRNGFRTFISIYPIESCAPTNRRFETRRKFMAFSTAFMHKWIDGFLHCDKEHLENLKFLYVDFHSDPNDYIRLLFVSRIFKKCLTKVSIIFR